MAKTILLLVLAALLPMTAQAKDYTFAAGDKIHIGVADEPEYSADVMVRPDGKIPVPQSGDVQAVGLTEAQLQAAVTEKLKELIRRPMVSISLVGGTNNKVYVMGGGVKPTMVDLTQHATLLGVLTTLGDSSGADLRAAALVREGKEIKKDFYDLVHGGGDGQDVPLLAGDTIVLPPTASNRGIYVVGAVNTPRLVVFREGMTLLEAVLEAGGFSKFASPNDTRIVRHLDGREQVIKVKAKRLIRDGDMKENVVLQGGDMVIVEEGFF